jgi:hypothetical protein
LHHRSDIAWLLYNEPGLTIDDCFSGATTSTSNHGNSASCRFKKHDAKPFLFEPGPPIPTQHRKGIGGTKKRNEVGVVDTTQKSHWSAATLCSSFESSTVATRPCDRNLQCGPSVSQFGARVNQHVKSFARNQSTHAHYERRIGIEPKSVSNLAALALPCGNESVGVDTWRNDDRRKVAPRASARFSSGIPARGNDDLGPPQDATQN